MIVNDYPKFIISEFSVREIEIFSLVSAGDEKGMGVNGIQEKEK
jgi:hypothetical protein